MSSPKRLESYDPAYGEMFSRVAAGETFRLPCDSQGKAIYLTQRLRAYRRLVIELAEKRKDLLEAAAQAKLVEVAAEGSVVIVRPVGGFWASQVIASALVQGKIGPPETFEPPAGQPFEEKKEKGHGYY